ncbi:MAG: substrate-binding domain-containing protein, partial [Pseudobutyrivibrio sp.]|nr:substrate-binding domain-containing protein [Pseudobutyrivibrio sp.]
PKLMEKTAVFCNSDFYALRLIKYLNEHGKKVPEDISVAGYDDIFFSKISSPELTTIRQDVQMKAEMAVDSMMRMIKNKPVEHNIKLPVELIVRQSCKVL